MRVGLMTFSSFRDTEAYGDIRRRRESGRIRDRPESSSRSERNRRSDRADGDKNEIDQERSVERSDRVTRLREKKPFARRGSEDVKTSEFRDSYPDQERERETGWTEREKSDRKRASKSIVATNDDYDDDQWGLGSRQIRRTVDRPQGRITDSRRRDDSRSNDNDESVDDADELDAYKHEDTDGWPSREVERGRSGGKFNRPSLGRKTYSPPYRDREYRGGGRSAPVGGFRERFPRRDGRYKDDGDANDGEPIYGNYDGDQLYGVSPILAALRSKRRQFSELIVQEGKIEAEDKKGKEALKAESMEILALTRQLKIPIREFGRHELNMMSENRPHQGFILRAKPLQCQPIDRIPLPTAAVANNVILALDEVMDPQNLGALLRSSFYLGCQTLVVCEKNSAPLSPVVSKASSGAMEVMRLYSTKNMMKLLDRAKEEGWLVVGTALVNTTSPSSSFQASVTMEEVPRDRPIVLVLGNEGFGLRTNILMRCDYLVNIPSAATAPYPHTSSTPSDSPSDSPPSTTSVTPGDGEVSSKKDSSAAAVVDSLNVSVTGGILLHYFLNRR